MSPGHDGQQESWSSKRLVSINHDPNLREELTAPIVGDMTTKHFDVIKLTSRHLNPAE